MASVDRSLVAHLPLFAGLAADELDALLMEARAIRHPKNSHVFQEDEEAHFLVRPIARPCAGGKDDA